MKLKSLILSLICLSFHSAFAQELGESSLQKSARPVARPKELRQRLVRPKARPKSQQTTEIVNFKADVSVLAYARPQKRRAGECLRFINRNGQLGDYGQRLIQALEDVSLDCFYNKVDFSYVCPSYPDFSRERKKRYLAFFFAALAIEESTCHADATNGAATNGRADGLFMLEYSNRLRKTGRSSGHSKKYCAPGVSTDSQAIGFQMECTAAIFADKYCRANKTVGKYVGGYWQPLNGKNRPSTKLAKKFPGCN